MTTEQRTAGQLAEGVGVYCNVLAPSAEIA
jgi:hypothetical protein